MTSNLDVLTALHNLHLFPKKHLSRVPVSVQNVVIRLKGGVFIDTAKKVRETLCPDYVVLWKEF